MDPHFVEALRRSEIDLALAEINIRNLTGASILEIGGGAGWQAQRLAEAGYAVRSFDLPSSEFNGSRVFPIEEYDGCTIPAPDASVDVVFSSNALEHIPDVDAFQGEIRRVLKPNGVAIHIVPSATWRLHTSLAHYPWLAKSLVKVIGARLGRRASSDVQIIARAAKRRSKVQLLSRILCAPRHGERGNALSEVWHFSRFGWTRHFRRSGWRIISRAPNRLYYTGYGLFDGRLSVPTRQRVSRLLGSACHVYC